MTVKREHTHGHSLLFNELRSTYYVFRRVLYSNHRRSKWCLRRRLSKRGNLRAHHRYTPPYTTEYTGHARRRSRDHHSPSPPPPSICYLPLQNRKTTQSPPYLRLRSPHTCLNSPSRIDLSQ